MMFFKMVVALALVLGFTSCNNTRKGVVSYQTMETECLGSELDGSHTVRAWGTGRYVGDAKEQAKKQAVYDCLFTGILRGKGSCEARPIVTEANAREKYQAYFDKFFADGGEYLKYISMKDRFSAICGITAKELEEQLRPDVEALAEKNKETYEEAMEHLRRMYDGYHFSPECEDIYNPFSLLNAFNDLRYGKYWFSSGTPTFLIEVLQKCNFDIESLEGITASSEQFDVPAERITNPVPVLYQSGYLTIKDYNPMADLYTLAYPNDEVRLGFINSLIPEYVNDLYLKRNSFIYGFTEDLRRNDLDSCMEKITAFFASIPYDLENKTEKHYHTIFYLLFSMMGMYIGSEVRSAVGRADIVLKTGTHIYVFELKIDGTADDALKQIDSKGYLVPYSADGRKLVKVGVSFDSGTRTVGEWKAVEA